MNVATELALLTPGNVITLHSGRELTQTRPDCEEVITWVPASKSVSASAMDIVSHPGFCVVEEGVLDEAHRAKRIYKKLYTHPTLL